MAKITRRAFIEMAISLGATAAWADGIGAPSRISWQERRDLYPEGVASGDPDSHSVMLWTRRQPTKDDHVGGLSVEVSEDQSFSRIVASERATISEAS